MKSHAYLACGSITAVIFKGYFKTSIYLNGARPPTIRLDPLIRIYDRMLYLCADGVKNVSISTWIMASCHVSAHLPINRLFSTAAISSRHDGDLSHANKLWWWQCLTNRTVTGRYAHAWTSRKKGPGTSVHFAGGDSAWVKQTRRILGHLLREGTLVCTEHHGYKSI